MSEEFDCIWKTLIYQGNRYDNLEVSNTGLLRNVNTGTVYKQTIKNSGYYQVCVSLGSRSDYKSFVIHKAVAETFIENPNGKDQVNHIDGNKLNNNVSNLEWVSCAENARHAWENGLVKPKRGTENGNSKLTEEDVLYIINNYKPRDKNFSSMALGRKFGVDHKGILDIVKGISYTNVSNIERNDNNQ